MIKQLQDVIIMLENQVDLLIRTSEGNYELINNIQKEKENLKRITERLRVHQGKLAYQSTGPRRLSTGDDSNERK